ncbi:serpin family protein [Methanoregula sp.]|uniref:serpin family protein n=1 Tax=Methanoregula sp. TaxID=2052170 RepID=UPI0035632C67
MRRVKNGKYPRMNLRPEQNRIGILLVGTILLCVVALAGCTGTDTTTPAIPSTTQGTAGVTDANNRFAFDLYSRLAKDPAYTGNNLFFSPFSLSSALAITYEGARGPTADEIRSVFYFPNDTAALRQGFADMNSGMNNGSAGYTLDTANALWVEKTYPFLTGYISTAAQYYGANATSLDFINRPEESRAIINRWVEQKTQNKIQDLVPAGGITPMTRLVITNAVYFKGTWVTQFDKNTTRETRFRVSPEKTANVKMMQRIDENAVYRYTETDDLQVLALPYAHDSGKELSMLVLLPKDDNLMAAERALDPVNYAGIQNSLVSQRVKIFLPKFRIETTAHLPSTLAAMGMPTAFSGSADFSGMDGTQFLYIEDIIHKTYIDVNEEGTEAAAATAVIMWGKGSVPEEPTVPVFNADHPFLFIIQDDETGAILFMGRVTNPTG